MPANPFLEVEAPLTFAQEYKYTSREYAHPLYFSARVAGRLDVAALKAALINLADRHDALLTYVLDNDRGEPMQRLRGVPVGQDLLGCVAVRAISEDQFSKYAKRILLSDVASAWDSSAPYPFRFRLLRYSADVHAFLASLSPVACDDRSRRILMNQLWDLYSILASGAVPESPKERHPFMNAARRQRDRFGHRAKTVNKEFWEQRAGQLRTNRYEVKTNGVPQSPDGTAFFSCRLGSKWLQGASKACRQMCLSINQLVLISLASVAFDLCSLDHIAIEVPVDMRLNSEQQVVGMFGMTIPIVLSRSQWISDPVGHVYRELLASTLHRHVNGAVIRSVRSIATAASLTANGPIRIAMSYVSHAGEPQLTMPIDCGQGVQVAYGEYSPGIEWRSGGMEVRADEYANGLELTAGFNRQLFSREIARRAAESLFSRIRRLDLFQPESAEGSSVAR